MGRERLVRWLATTREKLLLHPGRGELAAVRALTSRRWRTVRQLPVGKYFIDVAIRRHMIGLEIDDPGKDLDEEEQRLRTLHLESQGWILVRLDSYRAEGDEAYVWSQILRAVELRLLDTHQSGQ